MFDYPILYRTLCRAVPPNRRILRVSMVLSGSNHLARAAGFSALIVALSGCAATSPLPDSSAARSRDIAIKTTTTVPRTTHPADAASTTGPSVIDTEIEDRRQALIQSVDSWMGTPYRFGGTDRSGVDCSAFVRSVYREALDLRLPRTTGEQRRAGTVIDGSEVGFGDLVFFRISRTQGHVGVIIGDGQFAHASTSSGVTVSNLDEPYWRSRFDRAVRFDPVIARAERSPVTAVPRTSAGGTAQADRAPSYPARGAGQQQAQTQPQRRGW